MPKTETSPQQRIVEMDWPSAMRAILNGKKIRRRSWANAELYVVLTDGWLKHRTVSGELHQLVVCEADLLAEDWVVLKDN